MAKKKKMKKRLKKPFGVTHHKDGTSTYILPDDTRAQVPAGHVPAFTCADCGSIDPKLHFGRCAVHMEAHAAGVNFMEYCRDPSLWCIEVSGHPGEEVRCALHAGHGGLHGFPAARPVRELQERLGAVADAHKRIRKVERVADREHQGDAPKRAPGTVRAANVSRGDHAAMMKKTIRILEKKNPRREGTKLHELYAALKDGETVEKYMERSGAAIGVVVKCVTKSWIEVKS